MFTNTIYNEDEIRVIDDQLEDGVPVPDLGDDMPDLENPTRVAGLPTSSERKDAKDAPAPLPRIPVRPGSASKTENVSPIYDVISRSVKYTFGDDFKGGIGEKFIKFFTGGNKIMVLLILLAFASEGFFQNSVYTLDEDGLTQFFKDILGVKIKSKAIKILFDILTKGTTAANSFMDFMFLDPSDFTDAFPDGLFDGLWKKAKATFTSGPAHAAKNILAILAMLPAFSANTYSDIFPIDKADQDGGNSPESTTLQSLIFIGGMWAYLATQALDTLKGAEWYIKNEDPTIKSYLHHINNGRKAAVYQTSLAGWTQHINRGIGAYYMVDAFLTNRKVPKGSALIKGVGLSVVAMTAAQSFFGRQHKLTKHFLMGPSFKLKKGSIFLLTDKNGVERKVQYLGKDITVQYRYDQVDHTDIAFQFNHEKGLGYKRRFAKVLYPDSLAQAGFYSYFLSKLALLLPDEAGWAKDYAAPALISFLATAASFKVYHESQLQRDLAHKIERRRKGAELEAETGISDKVSMVAIYGAFAARTINNIPTTLKFCDDNLSSALSRTSQIVLAGTSGVVVGGAGASYYKDGVQKATRKFAQLGADVINYHLPCLPCVSKNPSSKFGKTAANTHGEHNPVVTRKQLKQPLLSDDSEQQRRTSTVPLMPRMSVGGFTGS